MFLICWQLFLLPTVTLVVDCALELFCRHDKVFPWICDQRRNQIRQHLQSSRASPAIFIKFCTWTEMYKEEKVDIQKLHEIPVPTHPWSMNLKTRTRDKMDTTLLFGINFVRIRTCWKEKFVHFAMEQCFSTCSVLEIERKNSWRWGSNGTTRNWRRRRRREAMIGTMT